MIKNKNKSMIVAKRFSLKATSLLRILLTVLFFMSILTMPAYPQTMNGIGKYGASFLQISSYTRQVAMGDAFTGLANDVSFLHYNIGGFGYVQKPMLGITKLIFNAYAKVVITTVCCVWRIRW